MELAGRPVVSISLRKAQEELACHDAAGWRTLPDMTDADPPMTKRQALESLGGSNISAARAIGCTPQAISRWPAILTARQRDRVQAAIYRLEQEAALERKRRWALAQELARIHAGSAKA
jgi:hypothetical protein